MQLSSTNVNDIPDLDVLGCYFLKLFLESCTKIFYSYFKDRFNEKTDLKEFQRLSYQFNILGKLYSFKQYVILSGIF